MMIAVKHPKQRVLDRYPKSRRVVAVITDNNHGLSVVNSLGRNDLCVLTVCTTPRGRSRYSRYSTGVWALDASPYDPEFIDEIERLAREYDAGSIMTIPEANHLVLAANRDRFEPDIHVFSAPEDVLEKIFDKHYMRTLCERIGVPIAKGMVLSEFLKTPGQELRYPRILRSRSLHKDEGRGRAPWKVRYLATEQEFNELVDQVLPIADNLLVEEFHPGVCFNVTVFMHEALPFCVGTYTGEHHYPAAGGVTIQRITCEPGEPFKHAVQLLTELQYQGNAGVNFRYDMKTHKYIFTEVHPRFEGATPTIVKAGFDIAFLLWQSHFEPDKMVKPRYRIGMRTRDFRGSLGWLKDILGGASLEPGRKQPSKLGSVLTFLWHCGPWTQEDGFWWSDPMPFITQRLDIMSAPLRWAKGRGSNE